jgi:hypothetical protein
MWSRPVTVKTFDFKNNRTNAVSATRNAHFGFDGGWKGPAQTNGLNVFENVSPGGTAKGSWHCPGIIE